MYSSHKTKAICEKILNSLILSVVSCEKKVCEINDTHKSHLIPLYLIKTQFVHGILYFFYFNKI